MLVAEKNKLTKESLEKFGYSYDYENDFLKMFSKKENTIKKLMVSLYPRLSNDGKIILARMYNEDIIFNNNDKRLIILTKDKNIILNILYSKITQCFIRETKNLIEFVFEYDNDIFYKIAFIDN